MTRYVIDSDGYLLYSIDGFTREDSVEVDFDIGTPPDVLSRFHYPSRQWHDALTSAQRTDFCVRTVRKTRDDLLVQSDWTQLPDVPLADKAAWQTYRQALRDITSQPGYPFDVVWPTPPQ